MYVSTIISLLKGITRIVVYGRLYRSKGHSPGAQNSNKGVQRAPKVKKWAKAPCECQNRAQFCF